jgi:hypothetical protein
MSVTVSRAELDSIKKLLVGLRNSCLEGLDGTWDCSTDEGREGFEPMADDCEEIAKLLNIKL